MKLTNFLIYLILILVEDCVNYEKKSYEKILYENAMACDVLKVWNFPESIKFIEP